MLDHLPFVYAGPGWGLAVLCLRLAYDLPMPWLKGSTRPCFICVSLVFHACLRSGFAAPVVPANSLPPRRPIVLIVHYVLLYSVLLSGLRSKPCQANQASGHMECTSIGKPLPAQDAPELRRGAFVSQSAPTKDRYKKKIPNVPGADAPQIARFLFFVNFYFLLFGFMVFCSLFIDQSRRPPHSLILTNDLNLCTSLENGAYDHRDYR